MRLLRQRIAVQGFSQREIQRRLGWKETAVSQLLNGRRVLRFEHMVAILRVIDVSPADFFAELYPRRQLATEQMLAGFARLLIAKGLLTFEELSALDTERKLTRYL